MQLPFLIVWIPIKVTRYILYKTLQKKCNALHFDEDVL